MKPIKSKCLERWEKLVSQFRECMTEEDASTMTVNGCYPPLEDKRDHNFQLEYKINAKEFNITSTWIYGGNTVETGTLHTGFLKIVNWRDKIRFKQLSDKFNAVFDE